MTGRLGIVAGALFAGLAVAAGAFGTHVLKALVEQGTFDPKKLDTFEVAVRYQMYHALGLLVMGLLSRGSQERTWSAAAGWAFLTGLILFCGGLYGYIFLDSQLLVRIVPIGGLAFMLGWLFLAVSGYRTGMPPSGERP